MQSFSNITSFQHMQPFFADSLLLNFLQETLTAHTNGCFAECFLRGDFRTRSYDAAQGCTCCHDCWSKKFYVTYILQWTADKILCHCSELAKVVQKIRLSTSPRSTHWCEWLEVLGLVGGRRRLSNEDRLLWQRPLKVVYFKNWI